MAHPVRCCRTSEAVVVSADETCAQRCEWYGRLDLPVEWDSDADRILLDVRDPRICALVMPSWLGVGLVMGGDAPSGPVVYHAPSRTCSFLTGPPRWADQVSVDASTHLGIGIGGVCELPSPLDEFRGIRRWLVPPRDGYVPPMHLVLAAVRGALR